MERGSEQRFIEENVAQTVDEIVANHFTFRVPPPWVKRLKT